MQQRPDESTLLEAVAGFLLAEVAPKLGADKALQFRVMIAANLASVVAGELRTFEQRFTAEADRLSALLPAPPGLEAPQRSERLAALSALEAELAKRLREGTLDEAARAKALEHLWETAKQTLAVTNPRFELGEDP
jgi:hypothetical protein